jgi:hypothetical protein
VRRYACFEPRVGQTVFPRCVGRILRTGLSSTHRNPSEVSLIQEGWALVLDWRMGMGPKAVTATAESFPYC